MKIKIINILITLYLFSSCNGYSDIYKQLITIDSLLSKNMNDTAKIIMEKIDEQKLNNKEKAYLYILKYEIYYRLEIDIYTDKDIDFSINYYTKHYDAQKLANAYLYKALTHFYSQQRREEVIINLKHAEKYIRETNDFETANKIYSALSIFNLNEAIYTEALKYAKKEYYCAKKINNVRYEIYALLDLCVSYKNLNMKDSANLYISQCLKKTKAVSYKDNAFIYNALGEYFLLEDSTIAEKYFFKSLNYSKIPIAYYNIAKLNYELKNYNKALIYCDSALYVNTTNLELQILTLQYQVEFALENFNNAALIQHRITALNDSILNVSKENKSYEIQKKYDTSLIDKDYRQTFIILSSIIITIIVTFLFVIKHNKKTKKALQKENKIIEIQTTKLLKAQYIKDEKIKKLEETAIKKQNDANQKTVMLSRGESVYNDMKNQIKKIWQNYDFECCILYFEFSHPHTAQQFNLQYKDKLTTIDKMFLLLEQYFKKDDDQMCELLSISKNTIYSRRSKIKKKLK